MQSPFTAGKGKLPTLAPSGDKVYLTAAKVRKRYGDASDMTLWRWLHDEALGFPQPITIQRRRFWTEDQLDRFDAERAERKAA